jgi:hypothetical protein
VLLAACGSRADAADARVCQEVERVTADFVAMAPRVADAEGEAARGEAIHEVHIGGSHLLVAAGGDLEGEPDPDLAAVVRSARAAGVSRDLDEYAAALVDAYDACDDAGVTLADRPFEELGSLAREGLTDPR